MKNYVSKNETVCIGKINDIIEYLSYLSTQYTTVKEFIDAKNKLLNDYSEY